MPAATRPLITLAVFVAAVVALSSASAGAPAAASLPDTASTNAIRLVCISDNTALGIGVDAPASNCYPAQLGVRLGPGWKVLNYSSPGAACLTQSDAPLWMTGAIPGAMSADPQVVLIQLGANDAKSNNWALAANFETEYRDLIGSFLNAHSRPRVWLATPTPVFIESADFSDARVRDGVIPKIRAVAEQLKLPVIDLHTPLRERRDLFGPDGIHPTAAGSTRIAEILAEAIAGPPPI